jgi:DNA-binding phage protein
MNIHKNARTTPHGRLLMVGRVLDGKQPARRVAAELGISERTVRKWLARWRAGGGPALETLTKVMHALGLRISVAAEQMTADRPEATP